MIINLFIAAIAASIVGSGAAAPTANNATEAHHTLERRLYVEHLSMGGLFTNSDRSFSMEFNGRVQLWQDAGWNKIDFARTDYNNERWRIPNSSNCYGVVNPNDRKVVIVPCYSGGSYGWGTQWYPMPIGNDVYMYRNAHATDSWGQGQLCLDSAGTTGTSTGTRTG
ncbi:hypothetical protein BC829DRAFT_445195 [Chytridium lagenaria]|nr:hypothetical protein BC829DRAFT_445195 [Chytridium lagenaria]